MEGSNSYALVDKATGQVRFHQFDGAGKIGEIGPLNTHLSNVSGISSGFESSGQEYLTLSSITTNRIAFIAPSDSYPSYLFSDIPGPENSFPLNVSGNLDNPIFISSHYGTGGHGLELIKDPLSTNETLDQIEPLPALTNALPLRDPVSGDQRGVALYDSPAPDTILELYRSGDSIFGNVKSPVSSGSRLTTEVVASDGRICTIAYVPGATNAEVFTHTFGGFSESLVPSSTWDFPIGSIAPIPYGGLPGATDGILITAYDGSTAAYARITPNAAAPTIPTEFKFISIETFSPDPDQLFTGLLPVPNSGIIAFQGSGDQISSNWRYFTNSGACLLYTSDAADE